LCCGADKLLAGRIEKNVWRAHRNGFFYQPIFAMYPSRFAAFTLLFALLLHCFALSRAASIFEIESTPVVLSAAKPGVVHLFPTFYPDVSIAKTTELQI
jgi:hypothetical protein